MIDLTKAPVVRVLVPYVGGSLTGYLGIVMVRPVELIIVSLIIFLAVLFSYFFSDTRKGWKCRLFSPLVFLLFFWTGLGVGVADRPRNPGLPVNEGIVISGRVLELSSQQQGRISFEMDLQMSATPDTLCFTSTRVRAVMDMPSDSVVPVPGETWMMTGKLAAITAAGNPGEVDYAAILRRKNCWYRFYCDSASGSARLLEESSGRGPVAVMVREAVLTIWQGPPETVSLLKAVCLGDRSGLSEELQQSYSRAGGMHVLAVSGLHVGLIWWVLHRVFSVLVRLSGKEIIRVVLIIILLWFYAWVTGFSSSVCRSVTMFSLFSLARLTKQPRAPVNVILVSMFFMLVIHPGRLLDVGFQLSYSAVLAIVTIYPVLNRLIRVKNRLLKWAWEATGISLAAQLGTLPLVIHYFHQVPVYALLTNLLVIPLLSCIIALFVISVPFMAFGIATGPFNSLLMITGGWMNRIMESVSTLPGSVIGNLFLDGVPTVLCLILVFQGISLLKGSGSLARTGIILNVGLLLSWSAVSRYSAFYSNQLVVANFYQNSLVTFREGTKVDHYIWCFDSSSLAYIDYYLETAWGRRYCEVSVIMVDGNDLAKGGISACCTLGPGTWLVGNGNIRGLVIARHSKDVQAVLLSQVQAELLSQVQAEFLLISGEPVIEPGHREILFQMPWDVIADGTNRNWYTNQLEEFAGQAHITRTRGAYRLYY